MAYEEAFGGRAIIIAAKTSSPKRAELNKRVEACLQAGRFSPKPIKSEGRIRENSRDFGIFHDRGSQRRKCRREGPANVKNPAKEREGERRDIWRKEGPTPSFWVVKRSS